MNDIDDDDDYNDDDNNNNNNDDDDDDDVENYQARNEQLWKYYFDNNNFKFAKTDT